MKKCNKIKYRLVYNRAKNFNADGAALIQIKAYLNRKSRFFSTDVYVEPKFWDKSYRCIKSSHPLHLELNERLAKLLMQLERNELRTMNETGSCPLSKLVLQGETVLGVLANSFTDFYRREIGFSTIKAESLKNQHTTFNKLCEYQKVIWFEDLTLDFVQGFDRFLRRQQLGLNTIQKHHKNVQKYVTLAIGKEHLPPGKNPYLRFRAKGEEPSRVFLREADLDKLERLIFRKDQAHLARCRDFFLMLCYTGLRFSDLCAIRSCDVEETPENKLLLTQKARKTGKGYSLPLYLLFPQQTGEPSRPEAILRRILAENAVLFEGAGRKLRIFGITCNQVFNRQVKEVAKLAGVDKQVSSHCGRRTFATILATKVQMPTLQKLLQHATLDMTKIYVQLSNQQVENELRHANWAEREKEEDFNTVRAE